jgi:transcriptional regulator with XRE-family HTH domain
MTADQGPIVESAKLRGELVRRRKLKRLTQEDVARRLEWSASKLIRVEGGRSSITKVDLDALLNLYEASPEEREELQGLNRGARGDAWWDAYKGDISGPYLNYVGYEAGATFIRQFLGTVVPGLLQTQDYAEVLTTSSADPMNVRPVVRLRMRRQEELAKRADPPYQYYVLDEAVIRRRIGIKTDPAIMPNQLRAIADRAEQSDLLTVQIIPFETGAYPGLSSAFTLLDFDGEVPELLYLDAGRGELADITGDSPQVGEYRDQFEKAIESALSKEKSIALLRQAAEEMSLCTNSEQVSESQMSDLISAAPLESAEN